MTLPVSPGGGDVPDWGPLVDDLSRRRERARALGGEELVARQHSLGKLTVRDRVEIFQNVKSAAAQIIEGKGATNYAIGLAAARIIEALLHDENRILPVSSLLKAYQDIDEVCLSVPCIVNRSGVEQALAIKMNDAELAGLRNSAEQIKAAIRQAGF